MFAEAFNIKKQLPAREQGQDYRKIKLKLHEEEKHGGGKTRKRVKKKK